MLHSCVKEKILEYTFEIKYINQTNKDMFVAGSMNIGNFSGNIGAIDSLSFTFVKQGVYKYSILANSHPDIAIELELQEMYNLSDTTVFRMEYPLMREFYSSLRVLYPLTEEEMSLIKITSQIENSLEQRGVFYITTDLLTLFKKEMCILTKFADYYSEKE